jgi:hypothetical protein
VAQTGRGDTEEPEQVPDIDEVLEEDDLFKLAIRGHAAVEELMNATIDEAFLGKTPGELTGLPFRTRLALFRVLTLLPKNYRPSASITSSPSPKAEATPSTTSASSAWNITASHSERVASIWLAHRATTPVLPQHPEGGGGDRSYTGTPRTRPPAFREKQSDRSPGHENDSADWAWG